MKKILFVCLGNICRSPMAEFVMKDLVKKAGLASQFRIESAATSREEIGNPVYPPARRKLAEHGISCGGHAARQLTKRDYDEYDLLQLRFERGAVQFLRATGPPGMPELVSAAPEVHADMANGTQPLIFFGMLGIK